MERLPFPSIVLAIRNDDRVTFERARTFASAWGSSFIDIGMQGHIGSAAKLGLWPQGLVWLASSFPPLVMEPTPELAPLLDEFTLRGRVRQEEAKADEQDSP